MNRSLYRCRGLTLAAAALLLGAGAAACGGGQDTSTGGGGSPDAGRGVKYAACMRAQGVEVDDPKPGENPRIPVSQNVLDKATKACGEAPGSDAGRAGAGGAGGAGQDPQEQALGLKLQKCMRDNGWNPPKPKEQNGSVSVDGGDPAYQQAKKACKAVTDELDRYLQQGEGQ